MTKTYFLETYGCQMNKAESNALALQLNAHGWSRAVKPEAADLVVLNTCAVRGSAEERLWGRIGYYKKLKESSPLSLAVIGCISQEYKTSLWEKYPHIDYIVGTYDKKKFVDSILNIEQPSQSSERKAFTDSDLYSFTSVHYNEGEVKAYVPIMHGCNNFCSYCIVPYVRGREVSRPVSSILEEIDFLEGKGVKEITLVGQNVNSYRYVNNGTEILFEGLLTRVLERISGIRWVRFISSHPKDFSSSLIELIASSRELCNHIHLPAQHGSDAVLERMNRKYNRRYYLDLAADIKKAIPEVSLTSDILIGFPGETEQDVEDTIELIKTVGFQDAFTYFYNPREGTAAMELDGHLPKEIKLRRLDRIIKVQKSVAQTVKQKYVGSIQTVLIEGASKKRSDEVLARTEHDNMVVFRTEPGKQGRFATVRLTGLNGNTFAAQEVPRDIQVTF